MAGDSAFLSIAGLSELSEQIYMFVLHRGGTTPAEVAERSEITTDAATTALEELRELGLVAHAGSSENYSPVDPAYALASIAGRLTDRVTRIRDQIPQLSSAFAQSTAPTAPTGLTRVVPDRDEVASWYVRIQHQATHELMMFDRPPYVSGSLEPLEAVTIGRGVRWRGLYTPASFGREGAWEETARLAEQGEESRIVPALPIKLAMADRSIALVSLALDGVHHDALITESAPLVAALADMFEAHWARGLPIFATGRTEAGVVASVGDAASVPAGRPATREELSILALIGTGLTDEAIAERLGISERSLRRRSAKLMAELGAANRFQAGVEAARRGWV